MSFLSGDNHTLISVLLLNVENALKEDIEKSIWRAISKINPN